MTSNKKIDNEAVDNRESTVLQPEHDDAVTPRIPGYHAPASAEPWYPNSDMKDNTEK